MKIGTYIREIEGKWYAFEGNERKTQVYSVGNDCLEKGIRRAASWTDDGIRYVASGCKTKSGASRKAKKYGEYCGVG